MSMVNQSKPTTTLANASKTSSGETWASITTTWASETHTWLGVGSLITNIATVLTGTLWSAKRFPWTEATPWSSVTTMTNISKPM